MTDTQQALQTRVSGALDVPYKSSSRCVKNGVVYYDDTVRWPIWQSALLVLGTCGAFWGGVIYLSLQLFGN